MIEAAAGAAGPRGLQSRCQRRPCTPSSQGAAAQAYGAQTRGMAWRGMARPRLSSACPSLAPASVLQDAIQGPHTLVQLAKWMDYLVRSTDPDHKQVGWAGRAGGVGPGLGRVAKVAGACSAGAMLCWAADRRALRHWPLPDELVP